MIRLICGARRNPPLGVTSLVGIRPLRVDLVLCPSIGQRLLGNTFRTLPELGSPMCGMCCLIPLGSCSSEGSASDSIRGQNWAIIFGSSEGLRLQEIGLGAPIRCEWGFVAENACVGVAGH